ncbi:MAG TPA: hypothetical protein VNM47_19685 [Terriglobia bacterium]|nr:hypothetical protein [Terriglobia bacterium]
MLGRKHNTWLPMGLAVLAACLAGSAAAHAAENPVRPGDGASVPAKQIKRGTSTKAKNRNSKNTKVQQEDQTKAQKLAPGEKESTDSAGEIAQLKKQLALQQEQIAQLLQAMNKLQAQVASTVNASKEASVARSSQNVVGESATDQVNKVAATSASQNAPQFPSTGQVASLTSVIPASAAGDSQAVEVLRQQIDIQQKQIEKLQSSLDQQRLELVKRTGAAGDSQAVPASSEASSHTSQGEAQHILLASSASPSATSSATNPAQSGGSASKPAPQTFQLPAALKGFKPIGLFYISYQNGQQYSGVPGETTDYNSFQLKRGYFGADVDVTSYLTARFVTDITSDSTGDFKARVKYLYGKFHWKGNNAITAPYMEFGLAHMPWLDFEEAMNGFRMQDTMFLERNSIFNSADVGVLFGSDFGGSMSSDYKSKVNSHYAGKYGSWQVGVYNGGGYHAAEKNTNKVFEGRVSIRPAPSHVPGLQFTAFGVVGKGNQATDPPDWRVFDGMVSYESQHFTLTGQGFVGKGNQGGTAINSDGTGAERRGFSVFAAVHIPLPNDRGKISILGRADEMNSNTAVYNDIQRLYIGGVAWHFYKEYIWLFDYQRTNHSVSTIPGEGRVQATLQVGF